MKPVLYSAKDRTFLNNGIGVLSDTIRCFCTEVLNGSYEIELTTHKDGLFVDNILVNSIIKVKPNKSDRPQPFRVYSVESDLDSSVVVKAAHISYDTDGIPVLPFVSSSLEDTIGYMNNNRVLSKESEFKLMCDFSSDQGMEVKDPASFRSILGGSDNSIVSVYGGEYLYDNFDIKLLARRGVDRGVCFRYRKNITAFEQEINSEELYSGVLGYWKKSGSNGENDTFVYGDIMEVEGVTSYDKILVLDVTNELKLENDSIPTLDQINDYVSVYITKNNLSTPKYSMKLSYVDDSLVAGIGLGDTVGVLLPEYGIRSRARCNKIVFDCLLERNEFIEIGDISNGLVGDLASFG